MATAPTRVLGVTPTVGWASTATPKTSPTFDVQNGDLLVLQAFSEDAQFTLAAPTWTGTGTWTLRQSIVVSGYCTAYLYTCAVTATATGRTVSMARGSGPAGGQWSFIASVWRNHGGLGVTGKANASGAPALSLTAAANSAIVVGNSDWTASSPTGRTWRSINGAPMTETSFGGTAGVSYMCYTGYAPDVGAAGAETAGMLTPSGQKYSILGAEILGSAASEVHTTTGTATFGVSAAATTSRRAATSGTAALRLAASATSKATKPTAGTAGLSMAASATSRATKIISGAALLALTAAASTATRRTTAGLAKLAASASATDATTRTVARAASLALEGLANHTTSRQTAAPAPVGLAASAQTGASETHTTTGTAALTLSASSTSATIRRTLATAALTLTASGWATQPGSHATTGTAALGVTASTAVTTARRSAATATVALSATPSVETRRTPASAATVALSGSALSGSLRATLATASLMLSADAHPSTTRVTAATAALLLTATAVVRNPGAWIDVDFDPLAVSGHPFNPGMAFTRPTMEPGPPTGHPFAPLPMEP